MTKKTYVFVVIAVLCLSSLIGTQIAWAGGCCYINYSTSPGVANQTPAQVSTAFTNPTDTFTDATKSKLKPITDQKVSIQIMQPKTGQACFMTQEVTDANGYIKAECVSPTAGEIAVTFTLADNPGGVNDILKTVPLKLQFTGGTVTQPVVSVKPTSQPSVVISRPVSSSPTQNMVTTRPQVNPTTIQSSPTAEQPSPTTQQDQVLEERINQLEQEVAQQKQEVSGLRTAINQLLATLGKIFGFGSK